MANIPFHKLDEMSTEEIKRLLDITRNISTGRPNKEFVKKYAAVQKFWVDKSENFAKSWSVANLENPDELLYNDIGWTSRDRVNLKKKKVKEDKKFFEKIKSRAGYIVIIEDKSDTGLLQDTKLLYEKVKSQTGLDYLIYDYYEVSETLKRQLKIKLETLPENILLYVNNKNKKIYKRVVQGFSASTKIVNNTKFIFENAILEKDKNPEDRIKKGKK
jgi:conjugal transfer pilus assembly protein TraF